MVKRLTTLLATGMKNIKAIPAWAKIGLNFVAYKVMVVPVVTDVMGNILYDQLQPIGRLVRIWLHLY